MADHLNQLFSSQSGTYGYGYGYRNGFSHVPGYGYGYTFDDQEYRHGDAAGSYFSMTLPMRGDNSEQHARLIQALRDTTDAINALDVRITASGY